jgi:hypothetical protein
MFVRRISVVGLAAFLLVVGLSLPALAQSYTATGSLLTSPGHPLALECNLGDALIDATVAYYRREGQKKPLVVFTESDGHIIATNPNGTIRTLEFIAPKGSGFVTYSYTCDPPITATVFGQNTTTSTARVRLECPSSHPYLFRVDEVTADRDGDFTTTEDQYQPAVFWNTEDEFGYIEAVGIQSGEWVRAVLRCSSVPTSLQPFTLLYSARPRW